MGNTQNTDFNLFKDNNIEIPTNIETQESIDSEVLNKYGVKKAYEYLLRNCKPLIDSLKTKHPDVDFDFDLGRGRGYWLL